MRANEDELTGHVVTSPIDSTIRELLVQQCLLDDSAVRPDTFRSESASEPLNSQSPYQFHEHRLLEDVSCFERIPW